MLLIAILLAFAAFLGLVMELYKKTIRKDKAKEGEIKGVAIILSALLAFVTYQVATVPASEAGLTPTPFLIILYTVAIYILQLPACMAFWKPLIKRFVEKKIDE